MLRLRLTASAAILALGLAACGGDTDEAEMTGDTADAGSSAMDGEQDEALGDARTDTASNAEQIEPMPAAAQPSQEVLRIVEQARACQSEPDEWTFEAAAQAEDEDEPRYNARVSQSYLEQNAGRDCVFALPSGLQFTVVNAVENAPSPTSGELVRVDYEGRLVSGETFDSSYDRGQSAVFPSDRLITGWVEALPLMRVGEEWTLFIAPELAYGQRGTPGGPIGPNQALVFRIELLGLPAREQGRQQDAPAAAADESGEADNSGTDPNDG